ncbi:alpha/beta fold hydrolase [Kineococcus rhizosphaerae]|uniref:3-oxoadipate enol-lactonase n=1 Tax=Kineococcus rhizosphaerae TaxID=559628 RepID=A0A2T0R3J8_9ACTN|nr:alpha/beta fold hydrolase [Kineococcus rhizosphaerae]PRY14637.1 3-oxoadipate enol-lactonase [Kineococcus rhizosphaerae]
MTTLVLGPSLGTTAATCWGPVTDLLRAEFDVVAWELPGHGADRSAVPDELTIADLAQRVVDAVPGPFLYAGDSVGGQVGLQLLLDHPDRVLGAVLCCTGARIGTPESWAERTAQVRGSGTASLVAATAARWFAPGFLERQPDRGAALLHALRDTDPAGYVAVCGALARFDVRDRLGEIGRPVVAVAGAHDAVCPPESLREIADGVQDGRLVVLDDVAHQAPAEDPQEIARIVRELAEEVS